MSKIPGLEHLVKPIVDLLFTIFKAIGENGVAWTIFVIKVVWFSHVELFRNLTLSAEQIDPTSKIREKIKD